MKKAITVDEQGNLIDPDTGKILIKKNEKKTEGEIAKDVQPAKEEKKPDAVLPPKMYTKYEVKPDSFFVIKFGLMSFEDRIIVVQYPDEVTAEVEPHWVKFRMWNFAEELDMKSKSTEFDMTKKIHMLNNDKLNELKIRTLICDWSFSESDNSLKLLHVNKFLSDEGLKIFYSLYPTVIRHVIDKMNGVLEYNA